MTSFMKMIFMHALIVMKTLDSCHIALVAMCEREQKKKKFIELFKQFTFFFDIMKKAENKSN